MADENSPKTELLDDLESIRSLLEKDRHQRQHPGTTGAPTGETEEQVPMLDDVVAGGLSIDESPLTERSVMEEGPGGLDDTLFAALLGDSWKKSAASLLQDSRAEIERHRAHWTPADTDALNEALKIRIDETLRSWLRETVRRNMDQLREQLLEVIQDQLEVEISHTLGDRKSGSTDSDNPADEDYEK